MKFLLENFCCGLWLKHFNNTIIWSLSKIRGKIFCSTFENCEKCESLAQQIFPRLQYTRQRKGLCSIIPSCAVAAVYHEFPEADGVYTGFKLAEL